jgi:hypothetical protein
MMKVSEALFLGYFSTLVANEHFVTTILGFS